MTKSADVGPLRIDVRQDGEGRFLASIPELDCVRAYGDTEAAALRKVKTVALQVLADMVDCEEEVPVQLQYLFGQ